MIKKIIYILGMIVIPLVVFGFGSLADSLVSRISSTMNPWLLVPIVLLYLAQGVLFGSTFWLAKISNLKKTYFVLWSILFIAWNLFLTVCTFMSWLLRFHGVHMVPVILAGLILYQCIAYKQQKPAEPEEK